jgi:hypothetical protein
MSREFRQAIIDRFIEEGLTIDEMIKKANFIADVFEEGAQQKTANAAAAGAGVGAAEAVISWLASRLGNTTDTALRTAGNVAANVAPTVLLGSVALPVAAGYYGGNMLGKLTDPGDAKLNEIKKLEQIAELRLQTERLRQQKKINKV